MQKKQRAGFGSKLGIILATAGSAVGLGNVWRFPYMAGDHGGAAFMIVYIACVLILGIPCMVSEFIIGRRAASNTARAYRKLAPRSPWMLIGYIGVFTGFMITGYYAVVSGWCFQYIYASLLGHLHGSPQFFADYFTAFEHHPFKPVFWAVLFLLVTHFIIINGVEKGIERASKLMMPSLFVLLVIIVIASCMLPGAWAGVEFIFNPDFSKIDSGVFLDALGQSFYSLSIGMGCLCTYASYFKQDTHLMKSAVQISVIEILVAVLAGLMIFPAAFSVGISPDSGPSLVFITLPNVFQQAFVGVPFVGYVIGFAFYTLLALAALTSLISLHEVCTAFIQEEFHTTRGRAACLVTGICAMMGAVCSLSLGRWSFLTVGDRSLFDFFDFLSGQILLPLGGFLTSLFVGWFLSETLVREEFTNRGTLSARFYPVYRFCVKYVCPVLILLVFLNQLGIV